MANAVLDGADGLLLGAETLRGRYPVETVHTVLRIADSAEEYFDFRQHHEALVAEQFDVSGALFVGVGRKKPVQLSAGLALLCCFLCWVGHFFIIFFDGMGGGWAG